MPASLILSVNELTRQHSHAAGVGDTAGMAPRPGRAGSENGRTAAKENEMDMIVPERVQQALAYLDGHAADWAREHSDEAVRVATSIASAFTWLPPERLAEVLDIRLALVRLVRSERAAIEALGCAA